MDDDATLEQLPRPINAWGTPTPYGVSHSSATVVRAVSEALRRHVDMHDLAAWAEAAVCEVSGAQAACFCHCGAAGLVIASAAAVTGDDPAAAAALPRVTGAPVIAIQHEHTVDYGQPIVQALALSGATVHVLQGVAAGRRAQLEALAGEGRLRAVVFVESQLVKAPAALAREDCASLAQAAGALLIVDAAAQDWRLQDRAFIASADLTIFSAQKYLAAPTCGIVVGRAAAVAACKRNLAGIGRPMKPTKEGLAGTIAALRERDWAGLPQVRTQNLARAERFAVQVQATTGWPVQVLAGQSQGPYPRILVDLGDAGAALRSIDALKREDPPVVVGTSRAGDGLLAIELTHVNAAEEALLLDALVRLGGVCLPA